jgi:uncharacterized protein YceK
MGLQCTIVFVSACYSEEVGRRFIAAGVEHVICVKQTEMISDSSSLTFAKLFYTALFQGKCVRVAYEIALNTVIADESSSRHTAGSISSPIIKSTDPKFILLPSDVDHEDVIINPRMMPQGHFIDESDTSSINHCDKPPSKFVPRNLELQQAFNYLCSSRPRSRYVTIEGEAGIGKTAFVCRLAQYISERGMYDEICFIPLSRMLKHYEIMTHGDFSSQVIYLVNRMAAALASHHPDQEIEHVDDLIAMLDVDSMRHRSHSRGSHSYSHSQSWSASMDMIDSASSSSLSVEQQHHMHSSSKSVGSYRRILYILDGCESYLHHHPAGNELVDDIASDVSDNESSTTSGSNTSTGHPLPLVLLLDTILRRTSHVNFLLTSTASHSSASVSSSSSSNARRRGHDHISEPEKLIILRALSDMKMAELFRKVVPRPLTFNELGIAPSSSSHANEILSKQPWMLELKGNPRAMIYFVRHLSDMHMNEMVMEELVDYAKRAYSDAIHYRSSHSAVMFDGISTSSSRRDQRSLSELSLASLASPSMSGGHHHPMIVSATAPAAASSSSSGDPSLWRTWVESLAQQVYSNMFTAIELAHRSPEHVYILSRQLSDNDRMYLYAVFKAKSSQLVHQPSAIISPSASSSSRNMTATSRLSSSSASTTITASIASDRRHYQSAQESYLQWWTPLVSTLKRFRYEFMCCYPIVLYGFCSRGKAEQLLLEENKPGLFLIRFSESHHDGSLVLSSLLPSSSLRVPPVGSYDELGSLEQSDKQLISSSGLRIYHHLLQVSDHGISLSFHDHRSTYSSLRILLEQSDSLRILYPDIIKSDLCSLLSQFNPR